MAYTDYPENDIRTHRSIAKWNSRIAVAVLLGGAYYATTVEPTLEVGAIAVAVASLVFVSAQSMRIQALEWELEETTEKGGNADT